MIKPLEDRVIIRQEQETEKVSSSGLVLSAVAQAESNIGFVVAVGEGRVLPNGERVPMDIAVNDKIVFNPYAVQKLEYDGQEYMVVFTKDILAIIEDNEGE